MRHIKHLAILITLLTTVVTKGISQMKMVTVYNSLKKSHFELPEIGKPMPDFTLDNVTNYKTTKASLKDFKGKWLILDLWFKGCVVCIKGFPHINELQAKFEDTVQFVLVGFNGKRVGGNAIVQVYNDFKKSTNLNNLASAYDSTLIEKWNIWSFPYMYIINPEGILMAITDGRDLTEDKLQQLIEGKNPILFPKQRESFIGGIDNINPKDSDSLIMYQSIITKFSNQDFMIPEIDYQINAKEYKRKGYKASGVPLSYLYNLAYFGKHHWIRKDSLYDLVYRQPILNIKDSSQFLWNDRQIKGLYNYSLDVPKEQATKERMMKIMQQELKQYFGYNAIIEERKVPIWILVAKKETQNKIATKGQQRYYKGEITGVNLINMDWSTLPILLDRFIKEFSYTTLLDETGIKGKVDLKIETLMSDLDQVRKQLNKYGIDLVKVEREKRVLVISDDVK